jgi:predicted dinucleotide-binding enzyme
MKIGVIGAGNIGGTIGAKWEQAGHDVVYGLRDPSKRKGSQPVERALDGAEVVLLALPGAAVVDFVRSQARALDGRIVIDATNNFRAASANSWPELIAALPKAQLFRAFNNYGWDIYANPMVGGVEPDLFYCGPEGHGKGSVERLIADVGLHPVWVGGTDQVGTVDGVLRLWYTLSGQRGRRIAFKLLAE